MAPNRPTLSLNPKSKTRGEVTPMLIYLQMLDTPEEKSKFETLYYTHRRTMLHIAMQILKDHQLAEDAVQEAFIRLAKNFSKIGQVDCPRTRLFVVIIVRNISFTMRTEQQKQIVVEVPETTVPMEYDLEEEVLGRIAYEEVLTVIQELPLIYRDILYLQCVEEYKLTEISKLIGIGIEAVKKRAQRGRKMLLEQLTEEHNDDYS